MSFSPEFELLVRCCAAARGLPRSFSGSADQTRDAARGVDQAAFVRLAFAHKTAATAQEGLRLLGIELAPEHSLGLKRRAIHNGLLQRIALEEAVRVCSIFEAEALPALVIKGPASSFQLYGDPFVREYNDIDILINAPDVGRAVLLMKGLGYATEEQWQDARALGSKFMQKPHHVTFWKEGSPVRVEIHDKTGWELEAFARDDIDAVFRRSSRLSLEGGVIPSPALADHAALILAHGTQHGWCLLHWLLDAAALCLLDEASLAETANCVRALRIQPLLKLACDLASRLFGIEPPPAFESILSAEPVRTRCLDLSFGWMGTAGAGMADLRGIVAYHFVFAPPLVRGLGRKAAIMFRPLLVPAEDARKIPLPSALGFLHILFRPFFVAKRRIARIAGGKSRGKA